MAKGIRFVGLDVHKDTIVVAVADRGRGAADTLGTIANNWYDVTKMLDRLGDASRLRICYEAGPTGFGLARKLNQAGYQCVVVAPSLVPQKHGQRIKTDRRDAVKLARFHRSGDLTPIAIPEEETEAMRDLERSRDDAKRAERAARHQLDKFLLRHGRNYTNGSKWTLRHMTWVRQQDFPQEAARRTMRDYLQTLEQASERVNRLTDDIGELVESWTLGPLVKALSALRGVRTVCATVLAAEVGDFTRFPSADRFMAYVGLVPSEHSSGQSRRQGKITKTGNGHVRKMLIEAAWNYIHRPSMSREIAKRNELVSEEVRQIAWKAQQRLHRRYARLVKRGKTPQTAITATARELAGFVWAIAQQERLLADGSGLSVVA